MIRDEEKEVHAAQPEGRRAYSKPHLQIYGDLDSITRAITSGKNEDHFSPGPSDMT